MNKTGRQKSTKTSHHHGDLREALISAGIDILRESGATGLTLRACAARAGVSHAAPAHHFQGMEGLLVAIAARGFQQFTDMMIQEREASGVEPGERLLAICRGYLQFAQENASLYNLMFSSENVSFSDADLDRASTAAYQVLVDGCAPFEPGPAGAKGNEIMIWSLLHGYAGLVRRACSAGSQHPMNNTRFEDILPPLQLRGKKAPRRSAAKRA